MYTYQYSCTEEVHCYNFSTIPLKLTLTPSYFITPDLDRSLNILCVELIRTGNKGNHNVGKTVCHILNTFIDENKEMALGYYPSSADNKEIARISLFDKWAECFVPGDDITRYKSILKFPTEDGKEEEELALQVFAHKEYPKDAQLVDELNRFSKIVGEK